jgi:hypothetical protein
LKNKLKTLLNLIRNNLLKKRNFLETNYSVSIIGGGNHFIEYIELIEKYFVKFGYDVYRNSKKGADVYIVIVPFLQVNGLSFYNKRSVYACIQTEQINTPTDRGFLFLNTNITNRSLIRKLKKYDLVFDSSLSNCNYLSKYLDTVRFLPYSKWESLELETPEIDTDTKYDLIFIGHPTGIDNRRKKILDRLKQNFHVYPKYDNLWGDEKIKAIQNSKICLNLHFDYSMTFEYNRFYEYISQKKLVISEFVFNPYPLHDGEHFITFNNLDDLLSKVKYYLVNDSIRDSIALRAHNHLKQYTFDQTFNILSNSLRVELEDKQVFKVRAIMFNKIIRLSKLTIRFLRFIF